MNEVLSALGNWLDTALGLSEKSQEIGVGQMAARALVMYIALLVVVRVGKKRFLGRATAFDVILVITLGSIAARAITGGSPLLSSTAALVVLIVIHWLFSLVGRESPMFSGLIKGHSTVLIRDGRIQHKALHDAHMSKDDLEEDLRAEGIDDVKVVKEARLERNGELSVVRND